MDLESTHPDTIVRQYSNSFNKLWQLFRNDQLQECVNGCQELLDDPGLPPYHRIRVLILNGHCIQGWRNREILRLKALKLFRSCKCANPGTTDQALVEKTNQELKECLDELQQFKDETANDVFEEDAEEQAEWERDQEEKADAATLDKSESRDQQQEQATKLEAPHKSI